MDKNINSNQIKTLKQVGFGVSYSGRRLVDELGKTINRRSLAALQSRGLISYGITVRFGTMNTPPQLTPAGEKLFEEIR